MFNFYCAFAFRRTLIFGVTGNLPVNLMYENPDCTVCRNGYVHVLSSSGALEELFDMQTHWIISLPLLS